MDTSDALTGLRCVDCGGLADPGTVPGRCPDCGGPLNPTYDLESVSVTPEAGASLESGFLDATGLSALLPVRRRDRLETGHGGTPLVDAPSLADELGVADVAVKAEGSTPTGTVADREMAVAVAAARASGATAVALPSTGNGGQAAALAAARAGLASHSFVPSRTPFGNKAMINVHGGDMTVVEGRYPDAVEAFEDAIAGEAWHSLAPLATPYRHDGVKPLAYEVAAQRGWSAPDRVVVPTGQVTTLLGVRAGFHELEALGLTDDVPKLVVAQAAGCAPLVDAWERDADDAPAVEHPDSVSGTLEVPRPAGGRLALAAVEETNGTAVAVEDETMLESATSLAEAGVATSVTGGAAAGAVRSLAEDGAFRADEELVLVDPVSADKEADLLRSYLMSQGR